MAHMIWEAYVGTDQEWAYFRGAGEDIAIALSSIVRPENVWAFDEEWEWDTRTAWTRSYLRIVKRLLH